MDDEREIRDGLDRIAGELPPAGRPPQRFRHRARRRMAVSGALVGLVVLALIGGSVAGLQALDLKRESNPNKIGRAHV